MPSALLMGDKGTEIVNGEEKIILYWADYRAAKAEPKPLVPEPQAQRTNQDRTPFIPTL
jgi:hypothetical protein